EATFAFFAQTLHAQTPFHLFYGIGQVPFLFYGYLSLIFKLFGVSLESFWLAPALLSAATLPLVFLTTRRSFGKTSGWVLTCLWTFSFWPLYAGRFGVQYALYLFWMWLALFFLGRILVATDRPALSSDLLLLGTVTGMGFYISTGW